MSALVVRLEEVDLDPEHGRPGGEAGVDLRRVSWP
jgi:hypothetical protein